MGWFGPQSGARDGNKEYRATTRHGWFSTGSHWEAEKKMNKRDLKRTRAAEKREAKREAERERRAAEGKKGFFY
jgi:hypothetical protein